MNKLLLISLLLATGACRSTMTKEEQREARENARGPAGKQEDQIGMLQVAFLTGCWGSLSDLRDNKVLTQEQVLNYMQRCGKLTDEYGAKLKELSKGKQ